MARSNAPTLRLVGVAFAGLPGGSWPIESPSPLPAPLTEARASVLLRCAGVEDLDVGAVGVDRRGVDVAAYDVPDQTIRDIGCGDDDYDVGHRRGRAVVNVDAIREQKSPRVLRISRMALLRPSSNSMTRPFQIWRRISSRVTSRPARLTSRASICKDGRVFPRVIPRGAARRCSCPAETRGTSVGTPRTSASCLLACPFSSHRTERQFRSPRPKREYDPPSLSSDMVNRRAPHRLSAARPGRK